MVQGKEQHDRVGEWSENSVNMVKDQTKRKLSAMVVEESLVTWGTGWFNIQEERLDEANDRHWEEYNSAVDESTSTDDEDCRDHGNEVHEEEYLHVAQQNLHIF